MGSIWLEVVESESEWELIDDEATVKAGESVDGAAPSNVDEARLHTGEFTRAQCLYKGIWSSAMLNLDKQDL